jgi:sodium transport system ATP-binding protein
MAKGRSVAQGTVEELLAQTGQTNFEDAFVKLAFESPVTGVAP